MRQWSRRGLGISTFFCVEVLKLILSMRSLSMLIGASQRVTAIRSA